MDINAILIELRAERDSIDQAIAALAAVNSTGRSLAGRAKGRTRRTMSAAARARIAAAQRARWAKQKQATASKPARRISRAGRQRIAAAQRARWAKVRAQQQRAA